MNLLVPAIHLNGSSAESLIDGYCEAASAVQKAAEAVVAAGPNARDYYVLGPEAFARAQKEHGARVEKLKQVWAELEYLATAIDEKRDGLS